MNIEVEEMKIKQLIMIFQVIEKPDEDIKLENS